MPPICPKSKGTYTRVLKEKKTKRLTVKKLDKTVKIKSKSKSKSKSSAQGSPVLTSPQKKETLP